MYTLICMIIVGSSIPLILLSKPLHMTMITHDFYFSESRIVHVLQRAAWVRVPAKTRGHPQPAGPAGHPQNLLWVRVRVQTQFCGLSAGAGQLFFAGFLAGFSWMNRIFTRAKLLFCTRDIRDMPAIFLVHYMSNYQ